MVRFGGGQIGVRGLGRVGQVGVRLYSFYVLFIRFVFQDEVLDGSARIGVYISRGFIQDDGAGVIYKGNGYGEFAFYVV